MLLRRKIENKSVKKSIFLEDLELTREAINKLKCEKINAPKT